MCATVNSNPLLLTGHTQEVSSVAWSNQDLHKVTLTRNIEKNAEVEAQS